MSRVAKKPIPLPKGVEVKLEGQNFEVKGTKGSLTHTIPRGVEVELNDNVLSFQPRQRSAIPIVGTTRALINNMVQGVTQGFEKKLTLVGVGYRAQVQGTNLNLTLGYSHPVNFSLPTGITIETPSQTEIVVKGIDKQIVGQVAAEIRGFRSPEPYKGKGVRYADEHIALKETKKKK
jgi:large subunit ribosomal protein L6